MQLTMSSRIHLHLPPASHPRHVCSASWASASMSFCTVSPLYPFPFPFPSPSFPLSLANGWRAKVDTTPPAESQTASLPRAAAASADFCRLQFDFEASNTFREEKLLFVFPPLFSSFYSYMSHWLQNKRAKFSLPGVKRFVN